MGDDGGAPASEQLAEDGRRHRRDCGARARRIPAYRGASSQNVAAPATSERAPAIASPSPLPAVTTPPGHPVATSRTNSVVICGFQADPAAGEPRSPRNASPPSPFSAGRRPTAASARAAPPTPAPPSPAPRPATRPRATSAPPPSIPGVSDEKFCRCVGRRAGGGQRRPEPLCSIRFRRGCRAVQARASGAANERLRHGCPKFVASLRLSVRWAR